MRQESPFIQNGSIVLASKSPRRRMLLEQAGFRFSVFESGVDEDSFPWTEPALYTKTLATAKAEYVAERFPESWVIGADTIVVLGEEVLGKPRSIEEARDMITRLGGTTHKVYTGFAVVCEKAGHRHAESVETEVTFKPLSARDIEWYIHTDEPYDKAGGYAIQGLGTLLVSRVNGSYTNVVGLPVCELVSHLVSSGVIDLSRDGR